ncbi:MAG TPA: DUF4397 domain-containing protein [Gemmatimonadales bacterium]|nr:DUF4397 domain-containing protein [Gemmatimonadales bacterium]
MRRIAVLLAALALGCGYDSPGGPFIIGGGGNGVTRLRFLHAVADGANLQLLDDGQTDMGEIGFASVTPYIQTSDSSVRLTLNSSLSVTPVIDTTVTLPDSSLVTVVAEGPDSAIALRFVIDGRASPDTAIIKVRVLHEAPSGGSLDVYITAPLADLNLATPNVTGVTFGTATSYEALPSGNYQVRLTTAGTKTVVVDSGSLVLSNGDVRTIVALDAAGGGLPLGVIVVQDAGT